MNIVGYLITLANIQSFQNNSGTIKDLSVRVSECQILFDELQMQQDFVLEGFKETGYFEYKNVGKYISNRLKEYIFEGKANPKDEAVVLTLYYENSQSPNVTEYKETPKIPKPIERNTLVKSENNVADDKDECDDINENEKDVHEHKDITEKKKDVDKKKNN